MGYGELPLEKRLKENIKNYRLANLYKIESLKTQMKLLYDLTGIKILLTERHGDKMAAVGNFSDFVPDVVDDPGRKLRVANRTVGDRVFGAAHTDVGDAWGRGFYKQGTCRVYR